MPSKMTVGENLLQSSMPANSGHKGRQPVQTCPYKCSVSDPNSIDVSGRILLQSNEVVLGPVTVRTSVALQPINFQRQLFVS